MFFGPGRLYYFNLMFEKYLRLLLKWNKTYNLTSITEIEEIRIKHFEDSLAPLPFLPANARVLDIGTGAGFPGIPLKIARPELEVVLLDSQRKKIAFCEACIRELKLEKISVVLGRGEDKKIEKGLGLFDVVISRATFSLADFLNLSRKYMKSTGMAIAMKGKNWREEDQPPLDWKLEKVFDYELSDAMGSRTLLFFRPV